MGRWENMFQAHYILVQRLLRGAVLYLMDICHQKMSTT